MPHVFIHILARFTCMHTSSRYAIFTFCSNKEQIHQSMQCNRSNGISSTIEHRSQNLSRTGGLRTQFTQETTNPDTKLKLAILHSSPCMRYLLAIRTRENGKQKEEHKTYILLINLVEILNQIFGDGDFTTSDVR